MFFPAPEIPYTVENHQQISVEAALVYQITTSEGNEVALAAVLSNEGGDILLRFTLPRHTRAVRKIFRRSGVREVPAVVETFNIQGVSLISFDGLVIGEDKISEDLKRKPRSIYVLRDVEVRQTDLTNES